MSEAASASWGPLADELAEVGADAVRRGLVLASGGNLSARLPEADGFVVTASGSWLDRLTRDDFVVVLSDGEAPDGSVVGSARPSSEWKLHHRTYRACPDAGAVIHLHPQYTVLLDALGHRVRLFTLDQAVYVGSVGRTPYRPNGSDELSDMSAEAARTHTCVIQAHHGCSVRGESIATAYRSALNLEQAAEATYRALMLGDTDSGFPPEELDRLHHA